MSPHPYPSDASLRRAQPWQRRPARMGHDLRRLVAVHEAGHVVVMRWVGLESPEASISTEGGAVVGGEAQWPAREFFAQLPEPGPDHSGKLAATAAAVYHAGVAAECIELGTAWSGPISYPQASDYQRAEEMLRERFGHHSSAGHAYAQQVAIHVLTAEWPQVQAIADQLVAHGSWKP